MNTALNLIGALAGGMLLAAGAASGAQEPLTWKAAVQFAANGNPDLLAAKEALQSSDFSVWGAYSGFLPQLSASLSYSYGAASLAPYFGGATPGSSAAAPVLDLIPSSVSSTYAASLTGTQNLFTGLQDKARVDQAKANAAVSKASLEAARAKASFDLKSAFAGLLFAQRSIELDDVIIKRREDNLKLVELRMQSGRENEGSLLLSRSYLSQASLDKLQAQDLLDVAKQQLARAMGLDDVERYQLMGEVPAVEPPRQIDFRQLVLETPDYQQSDGQEQAADAAVTLARGAFFPSLSLTGTTANTGPQWFPSGNVWSVQAGVTFAFFNGGKDYFATRSAAATLRAAAKTKDGVLRQSLIRLKQLYAAYVEATIRLKVDRAFVEAAGVRERIGRAKYDTGLLGFDDWDIIENDFIARERAALESERDRVTAEAAWEQIQGKGALP